MNLIRLRRSAIHCLVTFLTLAALMLSLHSIAQTGDLTGAESQLHAAQQSLTPQNPNSIEGVLNAYTPDYIGVVAPVLAILLIFGGPIALAIILVLQHYRSQRCFGEIRRECINKLIDAGKDVPESLLFFDDPANSADKDLSRGLKNLGLGAGIAIFLTAINGPAAGTFGLILIGLGGAQLVSWKLSRKAA